MNNKTCETCLWWDQYAPNWGECRRYPPIYRERQGADDFPSARFDAFCGEWKETDKATTSKGENNDHTKV